MAFTLSLRHILLRGRKKMCSVVSSKLLTNNSDLHIQITNLMYSSWILRKPNEEVLRCHLSNLVKRSNSRGQFCLVSSSRSLCDASEAESDVVEQKKNDGRKTKRITLPLRRDRQLGVELFRNILQEIENNPWTFNDWTQLSKQLNSLMTGSWEAMCMHTLLQDSNIQMGRSLMQYLEAQPKRPSPVITTFYIGLLGSTSHGDEEQEAETKKYYDDLVSVTDVFDAASIEVLVKGLSNTRFYKECIKLLDICRLTSYPGYSILNNILLAALRNHDHELCTYILRQIEDEPMQSIQSANTVIDVALENKNQEGLQKFFDFMRQHRVSLVRDSLILVLESFQRNEPEQWQGRFGHAHFKRGECSICGHRFPRLDISDEEFKAIQTAFLDQVIVSENIFYKSSPKEVNDFIKFVDKFGPFDVVVDGMNALHISNPKMPNTKSLERLVHHFHKEGKRVLLLGSVVLRRYLKNMEHFKTKPEVYLTSTTRADDAFFLYATLHSGKHTMIVSADKLRDHKFRLDPQLRSAFHRWLTSIQIYQFWDAKSGTINLKRNIFNLGPEKDNNGWHIPVNDADGFRSFGRQGILCLRHGPQNFVQVKDRQYRQKKYEFDRLQKKNSPRKEWFE